MVVVSEFVPRQGEAHIYQLNMAEMFESPSCLGEASIYQLNLVSEAKKSKYLPGDNGSRSESMPNPREARIHQLNMIAV